MFLKTLHAQRSKCASENFKSNNWTKTSRNLSYEYLTLWSHSKVKVKEQKIPLKFNENKFIKKFDLTIQPHSSELFESFLSRSVNTIESIMQENSECMGFAYSQTKKLMDSYMATIVTGHIFVFKTDEQGKIVANELISARPDINRKDEGYEVHAINNPRLSGFSRSMRVLPVKFSSLHEEIKAWAQQAYRDIEYPFIILTVPFDSGSITKEFYQQKSKKIRERSRNGFYALLSYHDPITGDVKENLNCIRYVTMFFEEIFGKDFREELGIDPTTQYAGSVFATEICATIGRETLIQDDKLLWPEEKQGPLSIELSSQQMKP